MTRVKRGVTAHRRHKSVLERAKGYRYSRKLLFKPANEAVLHSLAYAFRDRRRRKRDFRRLWIARINAASRQEGITYSRLMSALKKEGLSINRKVLAELALNDQPAFARLLEVAKKHAPAPVGA